MSMDFNSYDEKMDKTINNLKKELSDYISLNSQEDNCSFKENWRKEIIQ